HGDADGDHHADDAIEVAAARRLGRRKPAQRHDEADGGDQITVGGQFLGHGRLAYFFTGIFFLNIDSMRCVTMKPPKMLTAGCATALRLAASSWAWVASLAASPASLSSIIGS